MKAKILSISLLATFYALCIILIQGTFAISQAQDSLKNSNVEIGKPQETIQVPILTYHYIRTVTNKKDTLGARLSVTPAIFEEQLKILTDAGYHSITLDNLDAAWKGEFIMPTKPIILTFDDGYEDFYTAAYPLLQKYQIKATAYIVPGFINKAHYMTSAQIQELSRSPLITIGAHTMNHKNLQTIGKKAVNWEISESKKFLENLIDKTVNHFSYPSGKYRNSTIYAVQEAGFITATTTQRDVNHKEKSRFAITREQVIGGKSLEIFKKSVRLE